MRILVTGAAGFVGSATVSLLRGRGHTVLTTDRWGTVDFLGDLSEASFVTALPGADAVVHSAAVQYVSRDLPLLHRERYFHLNNVVATARLCERYAQGSTHFVNIGTSMMYEQSGASIYRVTSPMHGQGVYSDSKLEALQHVRALPRPAATIVPCIIGGIGREGLFRGFVSNMTQRGIVAFPGRGRHPINMVHVEDVAALIASVVETSAQGLFNAAAPDPLSILQWVSTIEQELRLPPVKRFTLPLAPIAAIARASGYRLLAREQLLMLGQPHVLAIDESLAIGWTPKFSNSSIVRDIARYISGTTKP